MTINVAVLVLILVLALLVGAGAGWAGGSQRVQKSVDAQRLRAQNLADELTGLTARAARLEEENNGLIARSQADASVLQAISPLAKQLDAVTSHVNNLHSAQAAQHAQVVTQLKHDAEIGAELSQSTTALNAALRSTSARGSWGEVQLRRVIEAAGMLERVDFDAQLATSNFASTGSQSRPDVTIHLPGEAHIAIDAKVPMDAYLAAMSISSDDPAGSTNRADLLGKHAKAVRGHVNALIKRNYPGDFPDSPQVTVMFLPSESLLAQATDSDEALLEYALSNGVVLASPSSLLALLRSVASVWSSAAITSEAKEIVDLGRTLVDRIGVAVGHLNKLGKSLGQSVNHYNSALQSIESRLLVTARSFSSIQAPNSNIAATAPQIDGDSAQVHEFRSPELTAHLRPHEQAAS